eukprot:COSAG05_NODE_3718_length_1884_cov_1.939530_1_plen_281_part_10
MSSTALTHSSLLPTRAVADESVEVGGVTPSAAAAAGGGADGRERSASLPLHVSPRATNQRSKSLRRQRTPSFVASTSPTERLSPGSPPQLDRCKTISAEEAILARTSTTFFAASHSQDALNQQYERLQHTDKGSPDVGAGDEEEVRDRLRKTSFFMNIGDLDPEEDYKALKRSRGICNVLCADKKVLTQERGELITVRDVMVHGAPQSVASLLQTVDVGTQAHYDAGGRLQLVQKGTFLRNLRSKFLQIWLTKKVLFAKRTVPFVFSELHETENYAHMNPG